ncbi:MAG: cytochrome-c oxidase, cbb3-type subunit III [Azoarcus sp.]|jgi:cytochrome c oxidase cbb3-type subunit 3|nr:cytochrome-c oxidase, cbb3-type subunit III [Azoarcus sp.]
MADFTENFWNLYVVAFTAFGLVLCFVLMLSNMSGHKQGTLKEHVWDETLREYNNPMPRWWLILFVGTVVFSIAYLVIFPGFGNWKSTPENDNGLRAEHAKEIETVNKATGPIFDGYKKTSLAALAANEEAMKTGFRLFRTYCASCHASSGAAKGKNGVGYPDLTDGDWLHGGDPETIRASIESGRGGMMTAFGLAADGTQILKPEEIEDVANYVLFLGKVGGEDNASAIRGKEVFENNCTACHGKDGKGTFTFGAPNLTDDVWLHGNSLETIKAGVTKGRNLGPGSGSLENRMPAWNEFLGEDKIHVLAAYVYSLNKGRQ